MDEETVEEQRKKGINLSQSCENAARDAIERLEKPKS
jgi:hypothetical protein